MFWQSYFEVRITRRENVHPKKPTWQRKKNHLKMYLLSKNRVPASHVSLPKKVGGFSHIAQVTFCTRTATWRSFKVILLLMVQNSGGHQLRLVGSPIIYRDLYIPGGCLGFLPSTVLLCKIWCFFWEKNWRFGCKTTWCETSACDWAQHNKLCSHNSNTHLHHTSTSCIFLGFKCCIHLHTKIL